VQSKKWLLSWINPIFGCVDIPVVLGEHVTTEAGQVVCIRHQHHGRRRFHAVCENGIGTIQFGSRQFVAFILMQRGEFCCYACLFKVDGAVFKKRFNR